MLYPDKNSKIFWDLFVSTILLMSCLITPFDLAFPHISDEYFGYYCFTLSLDCMFLIDIIINFLSATQDDTFVMVDKRSEIFINYIKGWFIIDVVAILPFEAMFATTSNANSLIRIARIGKLYKLIKIFRLLRLVKLVKQSGKISNKFNNTFKMTKHQEKISFFFVIFVMFSHFAGCMWIFIAEMSHSEEHFGLENEAYPLKSTNWIIAREYEDMSVS